MTIATGYVCVPGKHQSVGDQDEPYRQILVNTSGVMSEFVNSKCIDATRTTFKKPTILECMMQDYPKALPRGAKVGFTQAPAWICFSPCKINTADAASGSMDPMPCHAMPPHKSLLLNVTLPSYRFSLDN